MLNRYVRGDIALVGIIDMSLDTLDDRKLPRLVRSFLEQTYFTGMVDEQQERYLRTTHFLGSAQRTIQDYVDGKICGSELSENMSILEGFLFGDLQQRVLVKSAGGDRYVVFRHSVNISKKGALYGASYKYGKGNVAPGEVIRSVIPELAFLDNRYSP